MAKQPKPRKTLPSPPGMNRQAVSNFNAAQIAAEQARMAGKDEKEAFKAALRKRWSQGEAKPS